LCISGVAIQTHTYVYKKFPFPGGRQSPYYSTYYQQLLTTVIQKINIWKTNVLLNVHFIQK